MTPLVLRYELPQDDTVVVVRGGEMNSDAVRKSAALTFEEFGVWTMSVFVAEDSVVLVCQTVGDLERYGKIRLSTVGRLRAFGFPLIPTLEYPHFDVVLPDIETSTLQRLELAFDQAIPNPAKGR